MTAGAVRRPTHGAAETEAVGRDVGRALHAGDLLALHGELGAGKTCFVRGLAAGMGIDPAAVRSPTFVLHHVHRGPALTLHHVDLYRLGADADLSFLELDALLEEGAVAIEWAELGRLDGRGAVHVRIGVGEGDDRVVEMAAGAPPRLLRALAGAGEAA